MTTLSMSFLMTLLACDDGIIDKTCEDTETGCGGSESADTGADEIQLHALVPAYGSTAGGSQIEIQISGVSREPEVWFGEEPAEVVGVSEDAIQVITPEFPLDGTEASSVDVVLLENGEYSQLTDGFSYHPDRSGDQQLELLFRRSATAFSTSLNTYRSDFPGMRHFLPEIDTCAGAIDAARDDFLTPDETDATAEIGNLADGQMVTIDADGTPAALSLEDADELLTVDLFLGGTIQHRISDEVGRTGGLILVTPPAGENDNIFKNQGFTWELSPDNAGDSVVLIVGSQDSGGEIFCVAQDDGFFRIDAAAWTDFQDGDATSVELKRIQTTEYILPWNNAAFAVTSNAMASMQGVATTP